LLDLCDRVPCLRDHDPYFRIALPDLRITIRDFWITIRSLRIAIPDLRITIRSLRIAIPDLRIAIRSLRIAISLARYHPRRRICADYLSKIKHLPRKSFAGKRGSAPIGGVRAATGY
jgi:hypothetical protein